MTNNALVPRTQIKHGFQTALLISRYHSVLLLKGNPMPAVMTSPEKLVAAQALFAETLLAALPQKAACTVSGAGGGFKAEVSYSPELDLWYAMQPQGKKCWNGFGIGQPVAGKKVSIAAEINFPAEGLNRAVSGVFAEDGGRVGTLVPRLLLGSRSPRSRGYARYHRRAVAIRLVARRVQLASP